MSERIAVDLRSPEDLQNINVLSQFEALMDMNEHPQTKTAQCKDATPPFNGG